MTEVMLHLSSCRSYELIDTMVLLTMLLVSHGADASAKSAQGLKKSCCISF